MIISFGNENKINNPMHFHILSESDKENYFKLYRYISNSVKKYKRYKKVESIKEALYLIRLYCIRNDINDWKRCLVCGIYWIGEDIVINTRQLSHLICKCKSSINGAFLEMGYTSYPSNNKILSFIPFLNDNCTEQKKWSIRRRNVINYQISL